jgi:hypothetical protein
MYVSFSSSSGLKNSFLNFIFQKFVGFFEHLVFNFSILAIYFYRMMIFFYLIYVTFDSFVCICVKKLSLFGATKMQNYVCVYV